MPLCTRRASNSPIRWSGESDPANGTNNETCQRRKTSENLDYLWRIGYSLVSTHLSPHRSYQIPSHRSQISFEKEVVLSPRIN